MTEPQLPAPARAARRLLHGVSTVVFLGFATGFATVGCSIHADPDQLPPIAPRPAGERRDIVVAVVENATASAEVAQWSYETRRYIVELLGRTRAFTVVEPSKGGSGPAAPTLVVRFTDVRDEPYLMTLVYGDEQQVNRKRRAVVAMAWQLVAPTGAKIDGSTLESDELREGAEPIVLPTPAELECGSFWESPFGVATRENLDRIVRDVASRG